MNTDNGVNLSWLIEDLEGCFSTTEGVEKDLYPVQFVIDALRTFLKEMSTFGYISTASK